MFEPIIKQRPEFISEVFRVLGDKNRLHILWLLNRKELCVCEITDICGLSQSNVSQHLSKLKSVGLVKERRKAQWIYYSLNTSDFPIVKEICGLLSEYDGDIAKLEALTDDSKCNSS